MKQLWEAIRSSVRPRVSNKLLFPVLVLSVLYFFDEFDTAAFGTLAPDIQKSFHLTDEKFVGLIILNVSVTVMLAVPLGYLADRVRRTPIVVLSGILAGIFSFATGIVGTVGLLALARLGNGIGLLANGPVHNSLLSDYYPPEDRPAVFATHQNAVYLGAIIGPLVAGLVASLFSWQTAFMILIVPIIAMSVLTMRLAEPVRGGTDDPASAALAQAERAPAFREATRTLWSVRTLKYQYWGSILFGAGLIPLAAYLPLYYDRVFHQGPVPRGVFGCLSAVGTFIGVQYGGMWTPGWFAKDMGEPLRRAGLVLIAEGCGLALFAAAPWLWMAVAMAVINGFIIGLIFAPFYSSQALVSPARARTLSFSFGAIFLVVGVVLFYMAGLGNVSDQHGIRWGIGILTPFWVASGFILRASGRFVASDAMRALSSLNTLVELRRQREEAGARSLLRCTSVDVAYDSVQVLFGVDLEVMEGEIVALLGTNGAGKSTLLKAISGLIDPAGGAIFFDGQDLTHADAQVAAKAGIVQMPGGRSIFPTLTVAESLRLAAWMYKRHDPDHVRRATQQVLDYFPILGERSDQLAGNLSGGEQQMLGLAMAFIAKPRLLLIDELSLGLAPTIVGQLIDIVRRIHEQGTTIVIVEQSVNVALTLAERAVFMEKGEVRFTGPTADLLERDDVLRSVFLEGAATHTGDREAAAARRQAAAARQALPPDAPVVLELQDVTKRFGGIRAVDAVSFQLRQGEILGLIGPNGAGKTTVFDLISGFLVPDSGRISFLGQDVTTWSPDRRSWSGLARSFQDARLFPSLTVAENIAVALERHLDFRDPLASALGLPAVAEAETEVAWTVHELIELLGLGAFRNKFVSELSTGSRRIVDLAMTIAHQPSVLILDEPSSGIAQRETEALGPLLLRIQREAGCSLLVIEHDMPLITSISDTMLALELGRVVTTGRPDEVVNHPEVVASYLGADADVIARSGARAVAEEIATTDGSQVIASSSTDGRRRRRRPASTGSREDAS